MFEAFDQMVMHVCSWLMRFAELSKWILLSSKKLWRRQELLRCLKIFAHLNEIHQVLKKPQHENQANFQSFSCTLTLSYIGSCGNVAAVIS